MRGGIRLCAVALGLGLAGRAQATEYFVAPGASGDGTSATPFGSVQAGLDAAQPGDIVTLRAGTYDESLVTRRDASAGSPITVRGEPGGVVLITASGNVLRVDHSGLVVEDVVLDGQYGDGDIVDANDGADALVLRRTEIRRTSRDCVDLGALSDVVIESSKIHHCLNATGGRTDAHGVTGGAVRNLSIRDTDIHSFSGDAMQFDPGRALPGWSGVRVERCRMWLEPLPAPENGFPAGAVPGENAIDTKTHASAPRAELWVIDSVAWGFRGGLITNMAAFNLKERVDAVLDRVTVYDSEIAFRLRGATASVPEGAYVRVQNAVSYDVDTAFRYEDDIANLLVQNVTIGGSVTRAFQAASASGAPEVKNLLLLGPSLPQEAAGGSSLAAAAVDFVDAQAHDYHLAAGASAIDRGEPITEVTVDRDGVARPQNAGYDVGAYEACSGACAGAGGTGGGSGGAGASGGNGATSGTGASGGAGSGGAGTSGGASGAGANPSVGGTGASPISGGDSSGDEGGCGCRTPRQRQRGALLVVLLAAGVGALSMRRR